LDGNSGRQVNQSDLERIMLAVLAAPATDRRLGRGTYYLPEAVKRACPPTDQPRDRQIHEAIWSLIGRGLAYLDISQSAPENWELELTAAGLAALKDEEINPDDPSGYLRRLYSDVPLLSDLVKLYIGEALNSYYHRSYLASTVMLGVAAEGVFLELAAAFANWPAVQPADAFKRILADPRKTHFQKFEGFRKRLLPNVPQLPEPLRDGLELQMNSVLDLLRVTRNDAGHPTGVRVSRDDCFTTLRIFARLVKRMYELKAFFERPQTGGVAV
jgi:hypothetical protein